MFMKAVMAFVTGAALAGAGASSPVLALSPDPCFGREPTILGTDSIDHIEGTARADVIFTGDGDDRIEGRGGDDRICAGQGDDVVLGGPDNDIIFGSGGLDRLSGGDGDDALYSGGSESTEPEELFGDAGDDKLRGESTPEVIHGGIGRDHIEGGSSLLGSPDQLYGDEDDDRVFGGVAFLFGGQGDDYLAEGGIVSFAEVPGPLNVDLGRQYAIGEGHDALVDVAGVLGSPYDDVLIGNHRDNWLNGGEGNDLLDGRDGRDAHNGGPGDDSCVRGVDTFASCEHMGGRSALGLQPDATGAEPRLMTKGHSLQVPWVLVGLVFTGLLLMAVLALSMYRLGAHRASSR